MQNGISLLNMTGLTDCACTALSPNTRIGLSLGLMVFAYAGLKYSDTLEEEYPDHVPSILSKKDN